jgi:hypothetical protein
MQRSAAVGADTPPGDETRRTPVRSVSRDNGLPRLPISPVFVIALITSRKPRRSVVRKYLLRRVLAVHPTCAAVRRLLEHLGGGFPVLSAQVDGAVAGHLGYICAALPINGWAHSNSTH